MARVPLAASVFALLLIVGAMSLGGTAVAQATNTTTNTTYVPDPATLENVTAERALVTNLTAQVAELQVRMLAYQDNQTQFLLTLTNLLNAQTAAVNGFNGSVQNRLDTVAAAVATEALATNNASIQMQGLANSVDAMRQDQATALAHDADLLSQANSTIQQAIASVAGATNTLLDRLDLLDKNMTSDHIRLYEGLYVTDPNDPDHGKPNVVKVLEADQVIAQNQVLANNESRTEHQAINGAIASAQTTTTAKVDTVAAKVDVVHNSQWWDRFWQIVTLLAIVVPLAFLFAPEVLRKIGAGRARTSVGVEDEQEPDPDSPIPSEAEVAAAVADARRNARGPDSHAGRPPISTAGDAPRVARRRLITPPGGSN